MDTPMDLHGSPWNSENSTEYSLKTMSRIIIFTLFENLKHNSHIFYCQQSELRNKKMDTICGYTNMRPCDSIFSLVNDTNLATLPIDFCNQTYAILDRQVLSITQCYKIKLTNL